MAVPITINEEKVKNFIIQKIAEYWNGRTVAVSGGVGARWSDHEWKWVKETDKTTGEVTCKRVSKRVPGTHKVVSAITGIISATVVGDNRISFSVDYQITIVPGADDVYEECNPDDYQ